MYEIEGSIKFIADVLFNKPSAAALAAVESGQRGKKKTVEQKIDDTKEMVHRNDKGIIIPSELFKNSFLAGSKFAELKMGKRSLWPMLNALVFPEDMHLGTDEPDYIFTYPGRVPPKTGALVIIRRPAFRAGREVPFKMVVADDVIEADQLKIAIETAGLIVGIGSWRPKFGRFELVKWNVKKTKTP